MSFLIMFEHLKSDFFSENQAGRSPIQRDQYRNDVPKQ